MDRAALTDERRPIRLEYARNADQDSPAAVHVQRIVGSVRVVLVERNLIVDFDWMCVDCHMDSERLQLCHELEVEVGDRARDQRHTAGAAVGGRGGQLVFDQVEVDLEDTLADRNHRGGQPPSRHRECDTPPFIEKWRELELHLADDLQPHVQRRERGLPVLCTAALATLDHCQLVSSCCASATNPEQRAHGHRDPSHRKLLYESGDRSDDHQPMPTTGTESTWW